MVKPAHIAGRTLNPRLIPLVMSTFILAIMGATVVLASSGPPAPTLLSPSNGAQVTVPFTISWSSVNDAAGIDAYNWQISKSSTFSTITAQNSVHGTQTQDTISGIVNGTYYWEVQAFDNNFILGPWSAPQSFTITGANSGELGPPTLNLPQTGATTFHPYFAFGMSWSAVPGASSYIFEMDLNEPNFTPVYTNSSPVPCVGNLAVSGFPSPPPPPPGTCVTLSGNFGQPGTVYFRVRAVNSSGARSVPSNVDTVVISFTAPVSAPPQPTAPSTSTTETFPFKVSFTDVPIPQLQGYEVQFSRSSSFNSIEYDVPLIDPTIPFVTIPGSTSSLTVTQGLAGGTTYWRVRAVEGDANGVGAVTAWSTPSSFTMSSAPPQVVSITADSTTLGNGAQGFGQLQLSTDAAQPNGTVVNFRSSNPSALSVPSSVTVIGGPFDQFGGAGVAGWGFQYTAGLVSSPTPVTITASLGSSSASATVTVEPPAVSNLSFDPSVLPGGEPPGTIVYLNGNAPPSGATVSLSTNSAAVQVPGSVTIAAGGQSAYINLTTSQVTANTTATVTATYNGSSFSAQLTLTPQQPPASISLSPISTTGTAGATGWVTLQSPAISGGAFITLASSNPAVASVPPWFTISGGTLTGPFTINTTGVTATTNVTISASGANVTVSATLTVTPSGGPTISGLSLNPSSVTGGNTSTGTVTMSGPAPAGGAVIGLSSGNTVASVPASVTVAAGATSASFTVTTNPVPSTIIFNISAAYGGNFQFAALTLNPGTSPTPSPSSSPSPSPSPSPTPSPSPSPGAGVSSVSVNPTSVSGGKAVTGTVTLSAPAPAGGAVITLSSSSSAANVPGTVTVLAGSTSASFAISTQSVRSSTNVTISASYGGSAASTTLTVTSGRH